MATNVLFSGVDANGVTILYNYNGTSVTQLSSETSAVQAGSQPIGITVGSDEYLVLPDSTGQTTAIWKWDGSAISQITSSSDYVNSSIDFNANATPYPLANFQGNLVFGEAATSASSTSLAIYNTTAGTTSQPSVPNGGSNPQDFVTFNNNLYFIGTDSSKNVQAVYSLSGTTGTVSEIYESTATVTQNFGTGDITYPAAAQVLDGLTVFNGELFFGGGQSTIEKLTINGNSATASQFNNFSSASNTYGAYSASFEGPTNVTATSSLLYDANSEDGVDAVGTSGGNSSNVLGAIGSGSWNPAATLYNGNVIFIAYNANVSQQNLYETNGTSAATVLVSNFSGSNPFVVGSTLYYDNSTAGLGTVNLTNNTKGSISIPGSTSQNPIYGTPIAVLPFTPTAFPGGGTTTPAPTITAENSSSPSGTDIGVGKSVSFTVTFSAAVTVSGTPTLTLNDNGVASYASASGSVVTFTYTVPTGANTSDLEATAINLPNSATIQASGTNADLSGFTTIDTGVKIDTTAPGTPTAPKLTDDTGSSSSDDITSDPAITYATPASGDVLLYSLDSGGYSTTAPTFATDGTADGQHTVSTEERDTAGNVSGPSSLTFTLDTTAPGTPTAPKLTDDTGSSSSDDITSDPAITYATPASGDVLLYSLDSGGYSTTAPTFATDGTADGQHTVSTEERDTAGNVSGPSSLTFTLDTTAPGTPTAPKLTDDTGSSNSDDITSDPAITYATPASGDVLLYSLDSGGYSTTAPTFATDGTADGQHTVSTEERDTAGNVSGPSSLTFTLDTTAPGTPTAPKLTDDTGSSSSDDITSDPAITYATPASGDVLLYSLDSGGYSTTAPTFATDGTADGQHTVSTEERDTAGNVSGPSSLTFTLDTTAPGTPTAPKLTDDTGSSNSDDITSDPAITYATPASGDVLLYSLDSGGYSTTAPTFATDGTADGQHTVSTEERDTAGNVSGPSSLTFTLDTTAPSIAITQPIAGDNTINASEAAAGVTISGTTAGAEDGQVVMVTVVDATSVVKDTYTGTVTSNAWSVAVPSGDATMLSDGTYTVKADVSDKAGNPATEATQAITVDETAPTITAVADSGPGVDANGNGDLGAGKTVTFTATTSEPVIVTPAADGSTPTVSFNDGGTAAYSGPTGTATTSLTFSYTVAAGQNTAALQLMGISGAADVTDQSGNPVDLSSLATATYPTGTLTIDTTPPAVSSPTLTAGQNSGPTSIGIGAPSDNLTAAGSLAVTVTGLPSDGTVTLADGTTPVTAGEALTPSQLAGLDFTPTAGVYDQVSTFTYAVMDGAGNATGGTVTLDVGAPGVPTLTGTHATSTAGQVPVTPFTGVSITDPSGAAGAIETLRIALSGGGGTLTDGAGYGGLVHNPDGTYTLTGSPGAAAQELDALSFTPTAPAPGASVTTNFALTDTSSSGAAAQDTGTSVTDAADAVSISPTVTFAGNGDFVLTVGATSTVPVTAVEISAFVDGVKTDLGAATPNGDGTFTFTDHVGAHVQGFITATETDAAGGKMSATADFSLEAGIRGAPYAARQDQYSADGNVQTTSTFFRHDGSSIAGIDGPGRTVTSQRFDVFENHRQAGTTFVFDHGFGIDVVKGFRVDGPGHDVIDLPASDFTSIADVLRNTGDIQGSAWITDPKTGDAIRLAGVTKEQLTHNQKDFAFHA